MLKNYLKVAWRGMARQKTYSTIKVGGLALGVAACILITLFIGHELSYDTHYANADRIYRLLVSFDEPGNPSRGTTVPAPIKQVLDSDFPEIEKSARLITFGWYDNGDNQFRPADRIQNSYEEGFIYADPEILDILEIPMVFGDKAHALSEPSSLVISRRKAEQYFPNEDPVGKTVILNEDEANAYTIGGVMENLPANSHLQCDFLLTLSGKEFWPGSQSTWSNMVYDVYVRLRQGGDPLVLEQKLLSIRDNHILASMEKSGSPWVDVVRQYYSFQLQRVSDIYLASDVRDMLRHGDMKRIWLFGSIAAVILLLACINFINLSTARSANRAKEVGLRKVLGSYRSNLISQFITESILFSVISFTAGALLAWSLLPWFNELAGKLLVFPWPVWWLVPAFILIVGATGLLAGLYPALYLSAFKPIEVIKGSASKGTKNAVLRSAMVVFQFATSIVLIICTFITYQQMDFILHTDIGFDKEQVVLIRGANTLGEKRIAFKNELLALPGVASVTQGDFLPVNDTRRDGRQFWKEGRDKVDLGVIGQYWGVDENYIETFGIKLIEGRGFSSELTTDSAAIVINQTMARQLGIENPVGERIIVASRNYQVIGLVEDFHFESMKGKVEPLSMVRAAGGSIVAIKVKTDNMKASINAISGLWEQMMPHQPIRYTFLNDAYTRMYSDVERTGRIFTVFASLAIVVACLGLFALSAFMVEQRSKEISIRKVLGASLGSIFGLLTFEFLRLVLFSLIIAVPVGWYLMNQWLNDYAYRIEIGWQVFAAAGLMALLIALLTISSESLKAGLTNPVKRLRSE